jgi:hypothetical protein
MSGANSSSYHCQAVLIKTGCWGLTEQKIHLSRHRSSVRTRPASEISFRTDLQKS